MPGFRNETALPERETTILDVYEQFANGNSALIFRRGGWNVANFAPRQTIYNLTTGAFGVAGTTNARFNGFFWYEANSAAASYRSRQFKDLQPLFPGDESLAPVQGRYPHRLTYEMVINRAGPLVVDAPFAFQVSFVGIQLQEATTASGFAIYSSTPVNGGNWTVLRRLVSGGALTSSTDSGIPGTTEIFARIVYEHTSNPRLWAEINGQVVGLVQGVANMPIIPVNADWFMIVVQGQGVGGGVNQLDRFRQPRIKIEELAGYNA